MVGLQRRRSCLDLGQVQRAAVLQFLHGRDIISANVSDAPRQYRRSLPRFACGVHPRDVGSLKNGA